MPHITIEYSANVADHHDIDALVAVVHAAAIGHGLPPADGMRTRAVARSQYQVADGSDDVAFVAIAVRIGPGRDAATKTDFIQVVLDAAEAQLDTEARDAEARGAGRQPLAIAWSIELNEIDADFRINRNHVRQRLAERSTSETTTEPEE